MLANSSAMKPLPTTAAVGGSVCRSSSSSLVGQSPMPGMLSRTGAAPLPDLAQVLAAPRAPKVANTKLVTLSVTDDVPLRDVLFELGRLANVDIEVGSGLDTRGINYFLKVDARQPFRLDPTRVDLVIRTAAKLGKSAGTPAPKAYEHARKLIRRELIRRVVGEMLQVGL